MRNFKAYNTWAISWEEVPTGSFGLITPNTVIDGDYIPIIRFLVQASDYSGNVHLSAAVSRSNTDYSSEIPSIYSNHTLSRLLNDANRVGENVFPTVAIKFEEIDSAMSNLGRYSAKIIRAVSTYAETDSDVDNETASILLDAIATGLENAYEYIVSKWNSEAEIVLNSWFQYHSKFDDASEVSVLAVFDSKEYDALRSRTVKLLNGLILAVNTNANVKNVLGDNPKKGLDTLDALERRIHNMYGESDNPMFSDKELDAIFASVIEIISDIETALKGI